MATQALDRVTEPLSSARASSITGCATLASSLGAAPGDAPDVPYTVRRQGVLASVAGSIDAAVTLLIDHGDARILVLSLGGIPVLDGVSAVSAVPPQ